MANNDFETSLILRGKDLASQPIEVVVATVGKLIASLEKQTTAADAGAQEVRREFQGARASQGCA